MTYKYNLFQSGRAIVWRDLFPVSGFTMVELLAVMAILGILLAIALPPWNSFLTRRNLVSAQGEAYQLIRVAQSEAQRTRTAWQASFREIDGAVQGAVHPVHSVPLNGSWRTLNMSVLIDPSETTLAPSQGVYRVQFDHEGRVNGQLGRLTFQGKAGGRARRCVIISTLLGALRKGTEQSRADASGRTCY